MIIFPLIPNTGSNNKFRIPEYKQRLTALSNKPNRFKPPRTAWETKKGLPRGTSIE